MPLLLTYSNFMLIMHNQIKIIVSWHRQCLFLTGQQLRSHLKQIQMQSLWVLSRLTEHNVTYGAKSRSLLGKFLFLNTYKFLSSPPPLENWLCAALATALLCNLVIWCFFSQRIFALFINVLIPLTTSSRKNICKISMAFPAIWGIRILLGDCAPRTPLAHECLYVCLLSAYSCFGVFLTLGQLSKFAIKPAIQLLLIIICLGGEGGLGLFVFPAALWGRVQYQDLMFSKKKLSQPYPSNKLLSQSFPIAAALSATPFCLPLLTEFTDFSSAKPQTI